MSRSLTKDMRVATRSVHKLSDALVNAKLAFALNDNDVWADGLLVFYEIFKFLEENVSGDILPPAYRRTLQFEADLEYYKGRDWEKTYKIRDSVKQYLKHLNEINERNPLLLIAYVYHLYMGLLSGGQILSKKRSVARKFKKTFSDSGDEDEEEVPPGSEVTTFSNESFTTLELKNELKRTIDDFSVDFDDKLWKELIAESTKVFELNNTLINSVEGVGAQLLRNLQSFTRYFLIAALGLYLLYKIFF